MAHQQTQQLSTAAVMYGNSESKFSLQKPVAVFVCKMWKSYLAQHYYTESRNLTANLRKVLSERLCTILLLGSVETDNLYM